MVRLLRIRLLALAPLPVSGPLPSAPPILNMTLFGGFLASVWQIPGWYLPRVRHYYGPCSAVDGRVNETAKTTVPPKEAPCNREV